MKNLYAIFTIICYIYKIIYTFFLLLCDHILNSFRFANFREAIEFTCGTRKTYMLLFFFFFFLIIFVFHQIFCYTFHYVSSTIRFKHFEFYFLSSNDCLSVITSLFSFKLKYFAIQALKYWTYFSTFHWSSFVFLKV